MEKQFYFEYENIDDLLDNAQWSTVVFALNEFADIKCIGISHVHPRNYISDCFDDLCVNTDEVIMIIENSYGVLYNEYQDMYILDYYNSALFGFDLDKASILEMLKSIEYLDEFKQWVKDSYEQFVMTVAYETE